MQPKYHGQENTTSTTTMHSQTQTKSRPERQRNAPKNYAAASRENPPPWKAEAERITLDPQGETVGNALGWATWLTQACAHLTN